MTKTAAEACRQQSEGYHRHFPDCPTMTSTQLASWMDRCPSSSEVRYKTEDGAPVHLVDVRTSPERRVSVIPGSVPLRHFEATVAPALSEDATIVCYCTVGYRSGMACRRLRETHGLSSGRVRNLDGVVAYTHAVREASGADRDGTRVPHLVDGRTGEACHRVHVFGPQWDFAAEGFRTIKFSFAQVCLRGAMQAGRDLAFCIVRAFNFTRKKSD